MIAKRGDKFSANSHSNTCFFKINVDQCYLAPSEHRLARPVEARWVLYGCSKVTVAN